MNQGELADYNLLIDKINTNTDVEDIAEDCAVLQGQNNRDSKGVEILFGEKREKEHQVSQVFQKINGQFTVFILSYGSIYHICKFIFIQL